MYQRHVLNNGIRVITEHIPYVNSVSMGVWIGSGSRYENSKNNGVSHFIEHMLFKGTHNRSAKKIAEDIEELGGQINAFTGKEATCFYVKLLDEHISIGIDVLSDMLINPKFAEDDIEKEKGVILEEVSMYEDSPEDLVVDILSVSTWGNDTLSYPILGITDTISSLTKENIIDYFNKTYVPENIVISVAGNFNYEELIEMLEDKFSKLKSTNSFDFELSEPNIENGIMVKNKDIEQVHIALTMPGIQLGDDSLYTLLAVNNFFGGTTSSKLFQKLREEHGYVYTIYSFPSAYKNAGIFNIYFALNEKYIDHSFELIYEEIDNLLVNKLTDNEVKKAKEQLKGNYILGLESVSSRMFGLGKSELMLKKVYEPKEILTKIDAITTENVNNAIDLVFNKGILSAAAVGRNINNQTMEKIIRR